MHYLLPFTTIITTIAIEQVYASFKFGSKENVPSSPKKHDFEQWKLYSDKLYSLIVCGEQFPSYIEGIIRDLKSRSALWPKEEFAAELLTHENDLAALKAVLEWRKLSSKRHVVSLMTPEELQQFLAEAERLYKAIVSGNRVQKCKWYDSYLADLLATVRETNQHWAKAATIKATRTDDPKDAGLGDISGHLQSANKDIKVHFNFVVAFLKWAQIAKTDREVSPISDLFSSSLKIVKEHCVAKKESDLEAGEWAAELVKVIKESKGTIDDSFRTEAGNHYTNLQKAIDALITASTGKDATELKDYKKTIATQALSLFASSFLLLTTCIKGQNSNILKAHRKFLLKAGTVLREAASNNNEALEAHGKFSLAVQGAKAVLRGNRVFCGLATHYKHLAESLFPVIFTDADHVGVDQVIVAALANQE